MHHHVDVLSALVTIFRLPSEPPKEFTLILVTVRENEPFEKALRRFRRKVEREGIRKDIKKNSFYLKPGEKRRRKAMRRSFKRR